jgi:hypothetical protein
LSEPARAERRVIANLQKQPVFLGFLQLAPWHILCKEGIDRIAASAALNRDYDSRWRE